MDIRTYGNMYMDREYGQNVYNYKRYTMTKRRRTKCLKWIIIVIIIITEKDNCGYNWQICHYFFVSLYLLSLSIFSFFNFFHYILCLFIPFVVICFVFGLYTFCLFISSVFICYVSIRFVVSLYVLSRIASRVVLHEAGRWNESVFVSFEVDRLERDLSAQSNKEIRRSPSIL
jgi:membrane-associated HD superfamily phosphohydrolase